MGEFDKLVEAVTSVAESLGKQVEREKLNVGSFCFVLLMKQQR
jgi:hypothetical protein